MLPAWFLRIFPILCGIAVAFAPAASRAEGAALRTCILRDAGGMDPARLIHAPQRFDCSTPQHRSGSGDYWVISSDVDRFSRPGAPLNLRTASVWQDAVTLHVLYADGAIHSTATDARGVGPLIQLGAIVLQPLPTREAAVKRVLWHVRGAANLRGIVLGAEVVTHEQGVRSNLQMAGLYAGFAGVCIALIIYNLALYGALRYRFQLYYCALVALLLAYTFSSSGALLWLFTEAPNNLRLRTNYLLLGMTGAAAVMFARSFFEPRVFAGWVARFAVVTIGCLAGSGLLFFLFAPLSVPLFDAILNASFLTLTAFVAFLFYRAFRARSRYTRLFAIGWGAPILAATLRLLANLHVIPWSFWIDNSTILSMMIEAITAALLVACRIKLLRDERDDAIEREVLARRLADTDPLTGLLNRRAFLAEAIGREGEQVLMIADLDHFKRVNETLGHDGGDEVLRLFARMLRGIIPPGGLVARMGGEEFAILTPAALAPEPEMLLTKLRNTRMPFDVQVTASIGTCAGPIASEVAWKALYRGADIALYQAKSAGRDRVRGAMRAVA